MINLKNIVISGKEVCPIIEGGKGINGSDGRSSGHFAKEGCVGTISLVSADYYDEKGSLVGYSVPGIFGGEEFHRADGSEAGYSVDGLFGGQDFYNAKGENIGYSTPGLFGGENVHGRDGSSGYTVPGLFGGSVYHGDDPGLFGEDDDSGSDGFDW